jgi:hypothetical protein
LRSIAAGKVEKEKADKADRKKLEVDRLRDRQSAEQREEERRRDRKEAKKRPDEARKRPGGEQAEARRKPEEGRAEARRRPEAGRAEDRERGTSWEDRHVRERDVRDRLGPRQEDRQGQLSDPEETGLGRNYVTPRRDRPRKTTEASRDLPSSYDGYVIALPRSIKEKTAFQHLLNKKMLFRAPETGPGRFREPHFQFKFGESTPDSEKADRRRNRSPEGQEAARKRHRNHKD